MKPFFWWTRCFPVTPDLLWHRFCWTGRRVLMGQPTQIGSLKLLLTDTAGSKKRKKRKIWLVCFQCDRQQISPITFQVFFFLRASPNVFYRPFPRWKHKIDPRESESVPYCVSGYIWTWPSPVYGESLHRNLAGVFLILWVAQVTVKEISLSVSG